jgi:predicted outer membrane repeat protein
MKKILLSLAAIFFLIVTSFTNAADEPSENYVPNRIIIKLKSSASETPQNQPSNQDTFNHLNLSSDIKKLNERYHVKKIRPLIRNTQTKNSSIRESRVRYIAPTNVQQPSLFRIQELQANTAKQSGLDRIYTIEMDLQPGQNLQQVIEAYRNNTDIEYAEPDYYVTIESAPNDPAYSAQWSLQKIEARNAWKVYTGNHKTIVAVIDTGIDYNHPDIHNNMWINEAELNGMDGIDDDNNGYFDDIYGYNFIYLNGDPADDYGHGTHCAGIIAAEGNNNLDIAGICWNARVMALKFIGSLGKGSLSDAILAHYYAAENGADVISNSWSLSEYSLALRDAIDYVYSQGVIVVAAAGNYSSSTVHYPAGFPNVFSAAATNTIDNRWYYSSYGDWVDIAAPGVNILSLLAEGTLTGTSYNENLTYLSGTSTACPHIAGACALLLSANPYLTCDQVENILTRTCDPIPKGICSSNGRLNLYKAIQAAVPSLGYISFDRSYYTYDDTINILLADNDLKNNTSQNISIMTSNINDLEDIILTQTEPGLGVFTGTIRTSSGKPVQKDGILQVTSGQVVTAIYFDSFAGTGTTPEPATKTAYIDCDRPVLQQIQIETQIRSAIVTIKSSEPTNTVLKYKIADSSSFNNSLEDSVASAAHTIKLQPLALNTSYNFIIDLYDQAGNHTIADNNGTGYSFSTSPEYIYLKVPDNYKTIQDAIDDASDGDIIIVADGTYTGDGNIDIDFMGKSITLKSENGPQHCIIDCLDMSRAFEFHSGEDANTILDGFTVTNGSVGDYGGAILCTASSPAINNCIFIENRAGNYGGAIANMYSSSPLLTNCTFTKNSVGPTTSSIAYGGAVFNLDKSSPTLIDCTFTNNYAQYFGGAIYNEDNCNPVIIKCNITANSAQHGGGVYNYNNCNPIIQNSILDKNTAQYGGAIKNSEAQVTLINCTLTENHADMGGGIWNAWNGASELLSCILWNNSDQYGTSQTAQINSSPSIPNMLSTSQPVTSVNYCCIQGLTGSLGGVGNISDDPLFYNPDSNDYHLKSNGWRWSVTQQSWTHDDVTSPCIDAGNPGSPLFDEPLSIDGDISNRWGQNVRINMGAYGGTSEASIAPPGFRLLADINNDGIVNLKDYAIQAQSVASTQKISTLPSSIINLPSSDLEREMSDDGRRMNFDTSTVKYMYGDLNHDGQSTPADISILADQWLKTSNYRQEN